MIMVSWSWIAWGALIAGAAATCVVALVRARHHHLEFPGGATDEDPELEISPQTGDPRPAGNRVPERDVRSSVPPAPRVPSLSVATALSHDQAVAASLPPHPVLPAVVLTESRRRELLADAWDASDVDALLAQAKLDEMSEFAGLLLAGIRGSQIADPRSDHLLYQAFLCGTEPAEDELVQPYLVELELPAALPEWDVHLQLPCTREALGLHVATGARAEGDMDGAYGVLLDLPATSVVRAFRGLVALDLQWWVRAMRSARAVGDGDPWEGPLHCIAGVAASRAGELQVALHHLDLAHGVLLARNDAPGGSQWLQSTLFERGTVRGKVGDPGGAWDDLTTLLGICPGHPRALEALKEL